jgi:16S rRNA G1207 methylase RsmC
MKSADRLKQDIVLTAELRGRRLTFHSTWGLFSPRQVDEGTRMLIHKLEPRPDDVTLDLGCGYGAIGLAIAAETPDGVVHMVDKDFVALEYARKNAEVNGLTNVRIYPSNAFSHVGDVRFDTVCANLPAKVGKELLHIILSDARDHLKPGGRLVVVTIAGLRKFIRRNFEDVFGNYRKLKQGKTYTVAEAVRR